MFLFKWSWIVYLFSILSLYVNVPTDPCISLVFILTTVLNLFEFITIIQIYLIEIIIVLVSHNLRYYGWIVYWYKYIFAFCVFFKLRKLGSAVGSNPCKEQFNIVASSPFATLLALATLFPFSLRNNPCQLCFY